MDNAALRMVRRQAADKLPALQPPDKKAKDSGSQPQSLKAVHLGLARDYGEFAAERVREKMFNSFAESVMIQPDQIDLARGLAQGFKQRVTQMEERFGPEITARSLQEIFGRTDDEAALAEKSSPLELDINDLKLANAETLATELKVTEEMIKILSVLSPAERKTFLAEYVKKMMPGAEGDDYRAMLKEIIEYVLSIIEPYLPMIEPLLPQAIREPGVVNLVEGAINHPLENNIKNGLKKLDATISSYTELLRKKIECELTIDSFDPAEESTLPKDSQDSWTIVSASPKSDATSVEEESSIEDGEDFAEDSDLELFQQEHRELEEEIKALLGEVPDISHSLIKAHGYYRLIAAGAVPLSTIDSKTLKEVQQLADLTILCTTSSYRTNLATASTVQLRIKEALSLRKSLSVTDVEIDIHREVASALQKIESGSSAFDVARQQFSGADKRKQAVQLLEDRERDVNLGHLNSLSFGNNEADLLMQLKGMELCQNYLLLTYVFGFEGGQGGDLTKAYEQWERLHQFVTEGNQSIEAYTQENANYRQRLEALGQVPSIVVDSVAGISCLNRTELQRRIDENNQKIHGCFAIIKEAEAQRAKWHEIIENAEKPNSAFKRFFAMKDSIQEMEARRNAARDPLQHLRAGVEGYIDKPFDDSDWEVISRDHPEITEEDPDGIDMKSVASDDEGDSGDEAVSDGKGDSMFRSVSSLGSQEGLNVLREDEA